MRAHRLTLAACLTITLAAALAASPVHAFCGFYVAGADASLTNQATIVVMMREGTRTVLSMQNDYRGPPSDFALVVPVPTVIDQDHVRTLPRDLFDRVDRLASPRLVEYWERDPCWVQPPGRPERAGVPMPAPMARATGAGLGVTVEAQFEVGEYDVVILSARDSGGLETWLRRESYNIPEGASDALRPYVEQGTKFFVARVDVERVTFEDGRAVLSPLRVHYDADTFTLPVRLGLLNSAGTQDLVVHVLAREQRYDVANYPNVTIPTNLDVDDEVRTRFPEFYASLFDATLERNPGAVVTEYAWGAGSCDPCPGPTLGTADLLTLGADVIGGPPPSPGFMRGTGFVLTRLHYRYGRGGLDEDLVFREAEPIVGGRELRDADGALEHGATPAPMNNFQGRYAIRHPWEGPIECEQPVRGRWGGPPGGGQRRPMAAQGTALAPRGALALPGVLRTDAPEIGVVAALPTVEALLSAPAEDEDGDEDGAADEEAPAPAPPASTAVEGGDEGGCGSCAVGRPRRAPSLLALAPLALLIARRRRSATRR